jgi:predicted phage terminase large subunit-like protein
LSEQDLNYLLSNLHKLDQEEKTQLLEELDLLEKLKNDFLFFGKQVYEGLLIGYHHRKMAEKFEEAVGGGGKRIIINMAPRHGKSIFTSYLLPAWFLGKFPGKKVIQTSHTGELAVDFGRKVRNLIDSPDYQALFPGVELSYDSKAAGRWSTNRGGEYNALGVGAAMAGKGADLLIIDDPHALPLDTEIPTLKGWRTIGELEIGDFVYGPDGLPVRVTAKSEVVQDRELYAVSTDDGETVYCDGGHLWAYHSETTLKNAPLVKTAPARELVRWDKPNKPYLPRHAPVAYPHAQLPVDPYILGAWLGDGTSSLGLREKLRNLGVLSNKHVPEMYLRASIEQRMALLQGLMDTDGDVTEVGQCAFNNTNGELTYVVQELVHSLGVKASVHRYEDSREGCNPIYRVTFQLEGAARMPRKRGLTRTPTDKSRRSFSVVATGLRSAVQCITVDRADGQFLVGRGYVVTHNSEQEAKTGNPAIFDSAYEWYQTGPRQRLQPNASVVVVQTRWSKKDLTGRLIDNMMKNEGGDQWEVIELPMELPSGEPMWPEFWKKEDIQKLKKTIDVRYWQAQYQQNPTSEEGALVKREWWREWQDEDPPECSYIILSIDTAHEKNTRADFSAFTVWGVFDYVDPAEPDRKKLGKPTQHIILLEAFKERLEFPELKRKAFDTWRDWEPDGFIVEKKASGAPLIQELRKMGIPVQEFTPSKGQDKVSRVNSVSDMFRSGFVWAPMTRWAEDVINEVAEFPSGEHDDYVDSMSQALMRFRQGGFITLDVDFQDDAQYKYTLQKAAAYY